MEKGQEKREAGEETTTGKAGVGDHVFPVGYLVFTMPLAPDPALVLFGSSGCPFGPLGDSGVSFSRIFEILSPEGKKGILREEGFLALIPVLSSPRSRIESPRFQPWFCHHRTTNSCVTLGKSLPSLGPWIS